MPPRNRIVCYLAIGVALLATRSAEAGRPRSAVLDQVTIAVTHDPEFEGWANLVLLRSPAGEAVVVETRPGAAVATHRLGIQVPASGVEAHAIEAPDGSIFFSLCIPEQTGAASAFVLRTFQIESVGGDTTTHEVGHGFSVADPGSVVLGTLAVLTAPGHAAVETVSLSFYASNGVALEELTLAYEGLEYAFRPVAPSDGGWVFVDGWP